MHVDFKVAFHLVMIPNFMDMFLVRVVATYHEGYLAKDSDLDI